ncbi:hypothetical protein AL346_22825 (plasmid) [Chelatococcus sp. CO-6]|uniref:DUF2264 domain-containing protein n=2 Tax=unclassified Chelatococcus TaxID=2638111 RepID=UPI00069D389C|nr:DUF2264 domain-containing protein [Chelatococcus sp. CO-6]ALA20259.1 hypothetical protein AL346_22825 [Chelatococcus sp. CO-6]
MPIDPSRSNPFAGNPLRTRADVVKALDDSFAPLLPYFDPGGGARVRLDAAAAHFDRAAADFEGFARPLWGLLPLAKGGEPFAYWAMYRDGLANGLDPEHPGFIGQAGPRDQRLVELAVIGLALRLCPDIFWEPLDARARKNVANYLLEARRHDYADNNWRFFRVLVDMGLKHVGVAFDESLTEAYLDEIDGWYLGDGWYRDGNVRRIDHYIPFAMHFYGLIYAALAAPGDPRAARFRERARLFAQDIRHWFDDAGGALAFGRSLTYRYAMAGFWGALAFADEEALPWGVVKGHYLRHLRWWADKPIAHRDGVLSVGYGYPNLLMSENYNSAGSPYWAFKAFLPLALPESHPFWQAREEPAEPASEPVPLRHPGMVMTQSPGNLVALSCGQENLAMRFGSEKYAKFVYSSRYGFSVESDERNFGLAALDGMLAFSDDGLHFRVREGNEEAQIAGDSLFARWRPFPDVLVDTWLVPAGLWHIRLHRIVTPRPLLTAEGGFAIARADGAADRIEEADGRACVTSATDFSGIADLGSTVTRRGIASKVAPNTNLIVAKTTVPQLRATVPAGESLLVTAALASPDRATARAAWASPPPAPELPTLERLFATRGERVSAIMIKEAPR